MRSSPAVVSEWATIRPEPHFSIPGVPFPAEAGRVADLLKTFGVLIAAALMQDQLGGAAAAVGNKSDLCINDFQKIIAVAFGKDLKLRLAGSLFEEVVAFSRDGDDEIRGQLVASEVTLEQLGIDGDLLMLFGRRHQWNAGVQQVTANVIDAGHGSRVGQQNHTHAGLGVEAHE